MLDNRINQKAHAMAVNDCIREIERYADQLLHLLVVVPDAVLWGKPESVPNSIGALVRHLSGNLNHYFGAGVLNNGYIREREQEFHAPPVGRESLVADLKAAVATARAAVATIDEQRALEPHTTPCGQKSESLTYHIARLTTHFAYHVGEAYYASRLIDNG